MCGRFTLAVPNIGRVAETAQATVEPDVAATYRPRYNIAPTQKHWIVIKTPQEKILMPSVWGWTQRTGLLINLRVETIFNRDYYRQQLQNNCCLIPTDGFYEWAGGKGDRVPHWFHSADKGLMFFAGTYFERDNESYFTILTTVAEAPVVSLHERMPVFVPKSSFELWWSAPELFLRAIPKTALQGYRVSPRMNSTNVDEPGNIVPDTEENYPEPQYGLF